MLAIYSKCPKCGAISTFKEMVTENTPGVEIWSDSFCLSPERTDILDFYKCPECSAYFWLSDNSILNPADVKAVKEIQNSWSLDNMGEKELDFIKDAFRAGIASTYDKELVLRIKLWHTINHLVRRFDTHGFLQKIRHRFFDTEEYKQSIKLYNSLANTKQNNLIRLGKLIKIDKKEGSNNILLAEVHRELGDFSKAMIYCHKAETSLKPDPKRILLLKQHLSAKNKSPYKLQN